MLFAVYLSDRPDKHVVRRQHMQAHLDWLKKHEDRILVGGSLKENVNDNPVGGLWIIEAESKSEIEALIQRDLFWSNGLRKDYKILHWSKAFENIKVPI